MEFITIGKIIKSRGVWGEMKVYSYTEDYCMPHYCSLSNLWVGDTEQNAVSYQLLAARVFREYFLFSLNGIENPEQVLPLVKKLIFVPKEQRAALQKDEILVEDLIGSEVFQTDGEKLGIVIDFFHNGAHGVCEVQKTGGTKNDTFLFPTTEEVLKEVVSSENKIIIEPLEGML